MCGIIGAVSINKEIYEYLINGLKQMQNRGYDSAGLCTIKKNNNDSNTFHINKFATTETESAISKLEQHKEDQSGNN